MIELWIYFVDNYYALVGLTDEIQKARFAATLLMKQAALCLRSSGIDLDRTKWSTLKIAIRDYFRPSDSSVAREAN